MIPTNIVETTLSNFLHYGHVMENRNISYETIYVFLNRIHKSGTMISQQGQPIVGYLNEDGESNL